MQIVDDLEQLAYVTRPDRLLEATKTVSQPLERTKRFA